MPFRYNFVQIFQLFNLMGFMIYSRTDYTNGILSKKYGKLSRVLKTVQMQYSYVFDIFFIVTYGILVIMLITHHGLSHVNSSIKHTDFMINLEHLIVK